MKVLDKTYQMETLNLSKTASTLSSPLSQHPKEIPTSAYLHIPFCRRRCYYCDFAVTVVGDRQHGENSNLMQHYVEVLSQEITQAPLWGEPLQTVFFGGGTPSLLSVNQLAHLLEILAQQFGIADNAEISIEIDPATFDREKLQGFVATGVNRFSLGVQAFQDELLTKSGRSHTVADIYAAIDLIHQVSISNFSLDLISGLPHQTLEDWQSSLQAALEISPPHLSLYDLIIEPKTPFNRYYKPGESPLPSDEITAQMYRLAQQKLTEAGYEHYEVSNYAKPGYQSRHNLVYWHNRPYYGFGMGAASYLQGYRFTRPRKRQEYYDWISSGCNTEGAELVNTPLERLLETLMLGLRLKAGLNLADLSGQFGELTVEKIFTCLKPFQLKGWVEFFANGERLDELPTNLKESSTQIRLTDPEGFLFSNTVLASLFDHLSNF